MQTLHAGLWQVTGRQCLSYKVQDHCMNKIKKEIHPEEHWPGDRKLISWQQRVWLFNGDRISPFVGKREPMFIITWNKYSIKNIFKFFCHCLILFSQHQQKSRKNKKNTTQKSVRQNGMAALFLEHHSSEYRVFTSNTHNFLATLECILSWRHDFVHAIRPMQLSQLVMVKMSCAVKAITNGPMYYFSN